MGHPEKEPENKPKNEPPKLDAILPDDLPPAAAELVDDIDNYQKKMENEWESAKTAYDRKINRIMEEFLKAGTTEPFEAKTAPRHEEPFDPFPPFQQQKARTQNDRLKILMGQLETEFRKAGRPQQARLQLGFQGQRTWFTAKGLAIAAAVAIVVTGSVLFGLSRRVQITPVPYAHTLGPVVAGDTIYILDWFRRSLYAHEKSGDFKIRAVESLPNNLATGLAMSEKTVWTLDALDHKILLHAVSQDHQVNESVDSPGDKPAGLFFDGTDLWSADQNERMLYRHRGNDVGDIRDRFPLPEMTVTSFAFHKNRLWVLDGKSRLVTVFRLQKPMLQLAMFDLDPFVKTATPTGFAIQGNVMWMVTENPSLLLKIPLSRLKQSKTEAL